MKGLFFESLTRKAEIGANSYLLGLGETRIVLDAGSHPRMEGDESIPRFEALRPGGIDAAILTHTHLDHAGSLPLLMREFKDVPAYMTETTGVLVRAMLHNSVNVMGYKRDELGLENYPLFTHGEVDRLPSRWEYRRIGKPFPIGDADVTCEFFDAGHIPGSVGALFRYGDASVFYTGDVNFEDQTLSKGAAFPIVQKVDTLIMESTRGAYERPEGFTRQAEVLRLAEHINAALDAGGSVLIPVFALGKTQEVLLMLESLRSEGVIPDCPIRIGGLSTKMTKLIDKFAGTTRRHFPNFKIIREMDLEDGGGRRRRRGAPGGDIRYRPGCIYALSSGMMTEKTVSNIFARSFIHNPKNSLLFVGYAAEDTPARRILEASPGDMVSLDDETSPVELNCDVAKFDFSGHSTREDLLKYVGDLLPARVLLVHGDEEAMAWMEAKIRENYPQIEVSIPEPECRIAL
jgi:Cft2 family RNA processing exonuclease